MSIAGSFRGLLALESILAGCASVVLLSIVVPDEWRVWPLLTIWIVGCGLRRYHEDRQVKTDCAALGLLHVWRMRQRILEGAVNIWEDSRVEQPYTTYGTWGIAVLCGLSLSLLRSARDSRSDTLPESRKGVPWKSEVEVPKSRIFPCQTTHTRMFPKRHAFSYSYLQCGYPIVPCGIKCGEIDLPSGEDRVLGSWWLRVRAEDYLERGNGASGFYHKLKEYLRAQHVVDSEWEYAYLVTAPRFLGYAFNPVSFWYIYDREHQLKKMILEVNNTFGERRMYFLDGSSPSSPPSTPDAQPSSGPDGPELEMSNGVKTKFSDVWMKDFHVSPFNSRKGSYGLKAQNPFPTVDYESPTIDNTITLKSSKDHGKLVARLFSTGKALYPDQLGILGTTRFVLSWWWVGLVTFPRIIREAGKLFFKRKLHVWFRPEVLTSSLGRASTSDEIKLQEVFREYLQQLVNQTEYPFQIMFKNSSDKNVPHFISTTRVPDHDRPRQYIEIRVLTPAFYSRLIHYTYTSEAIDRECIFTDERNRTLWLCRPKLLPLLLSEQSSVHIEDEETEPVGRSYLDELRWMLLRKLRCPPPDQAYSMTPRSSAINVDDIRSRPYSELDRFVRSSKGQKFAGDYRRSVMKLFLAQRFCFGFSEIVSLLDLAIRLLLCYLAVLQMEHWGSSWAGYESTKCLSGLFRREDSSTCSNVLDGNDRDWRRWWWVGKSALSIYAPHAYGLLKGYR